MDKGYIIHFESCPELYGHDLKISPFKYDCPYCKSRNNSEIEHRLKVIGVPDRFKGKTLIDFKWDLYRTDTRTHEKLVNSFVDEYEKWDRANLGLYIHSKTKGTGKTFLASVIGNELIYRYTKKVHFISCSELIDIKKNDPERITRLGSCEVLIIDDLGQQKTGENFLADILFQIIDSRYHKGLMTIVTSNIKPKELKIDDRIMDRIDTITQFLPLPEVCIRNEESKNDRREFFKSLDYMKKKESQGAEVKENKESEDKKE